MKRLLEARKSWPGRILSALLIGVLLYLIAPFLVGPPVPNRVVMATGSETGIYHAIGKRYQEKLAAEGIELELRTTAGSVDNLRLLDNEEVSLAIVQGGTSNPAPDNVSSLGSLYLEPVWFFYRSDLGELTQLSELRELRIGIGAKGSGTRAIAIELLRQNGLVQPKQETSSQVELVPVTGEAATTELENETLDAAFFVIGPNAKVISQLTENPKLKLMSFRRANAYATRYRYLKSVSLTEGVLSLEKNQPPNDTQMLAATANLVANKDLHPALILLLLEAATEVHEEGGVFEQPGEFPSALGVDIPIHSAAKRYLKDGPSFLYRYLPFGLASWLDRVKLLLAPMLMLMLPLAKIFPPLYRFRIRSRIFRWYLILREIDQKLQDSNHLDFTEDIERLHVLQTELAEVSVPLSYMEEFYNLRLHVKYVSDLLRDRQTLTQTESSTTPSEIGNPQPEQPS